MQPIKRTHKPQSDFTPICKTTYFPGNIYPLTLLFHINVRVVSFLCETQADLLFSNVLLRCFIFILPLSFT